MLFSLVIKFVKVFRKLKKNIQKNLINREKIIICMENIIPIKRENRCQNPIQVLKII